MTRFVPREKLGKRARRELDAQRRQSWAFSPVTKRVESRKTYNRKRSGRDLRRAVRETMTESQNLHARHKPL